MDERYSLLIGDEAPNSLWQFGSSSFVFCRVELPTVVIPIFQASAMADEDADEYKDLLNWAASRGITDAPFVGDKPTSIRSTPSLGFSIRIATFPDAGG